MTLRCSPFARSAGLAPAGTAPSRTSFLVLEVPGPWPSDIGGAPGLEPLVAAIDDACADGRPWRLQAVVPEAPPEVRVIGYELPIGGEASYTRRELTGSADETLHAAVAIVRGEDRSVPSTPTRIDDLLVCTHGRRDACCGSLGTTLAMELGHDLPAGTRIWRTSHTGGHRFAPTAIHLPTGTSWAWLDRELTERILRRSGPVADVIAHYRGRCTLATAAEQLVEAAAFAAAGWDWLGWSHEGTQHPDGDRWHVEIAYEAPTGPGRWTAEVVEVGRDLVPGCGNEPSGKSTPRLEIVAGSLHRHDGVGSALP